MPGGKRKPGPDRSSALEQYRRRSAVYDLELALFEPIRREAIARLALARGQTVIDIGCGTGLSFALLHEGVGAGGRIVGVEQSPEMIGKARERVARSGWRNVELLCSPVESAPLRGSADAALFHFTHDILRRADSVQRVLRHLKPGARIVACGLKWARGWARGANLLVLPAALHSTTTLEGLDEPWSHLAAHAAAMEIETRLMGTVYIATGQLAGRR